MEELRCYGCGAIIQSEDEKKIGFVPKNALDRSQVLCKRCFRLKNYHQLQATNLSDDDFLEILNKIGEKDCLVVYLVDLFDFNGSLIQGLVRHINYNDVIVVGNKRDILPRSIKDTKIIHWLRRQLKLEGIKPLDVLLTSGKKNYHLDELMQMIDQYRKGRDVYVVGVTNVGKSSLINSLLKAYSDVQDNLITTSEFPGTTLDLIEIPLDENSSIYDSPGIVNRHQIAHLIDENTLKDILPQSELRPVNYQLNCKQTLYFGGLARLDFLNGSKTSMTCYFHRRLQIHRTKLENADALYNRHKTLKPEVEELKDIQEVCVTIGPGSFTGIRIGMCIAKTLAYANQIPLKAITSLNAYATNQDSIVVLDAKANRCYLGIYHQHKPVIQECVVPLTKAQEIIKSFSNYDSILDAHLLNLPAKPVQNVIQQMIIIANKTQPIENIDALVPLYLKDE